MCLIYLNIGVTVGVMHKGIKMLKLTEGDLSEASL